MWGSEYKVLSCDDQCRKNRIEGLYDSDGIWREDKEEVEDIILKYFKEIYSTTYPVDFGGQP